MVIGKVSMHNFIVENAAEARAKKFSIVVVPACVMIAHKMLVVEITV